MKGHTVITIELTAIDALAVGQSLRTIARDKRTPHGTREIYGRVGQSLVDAYVAASKDGTR